VIVHDLGFWDSLFSRNAKLLGLFRAIIVRIQNSQLRKRVLKVTETLGIGPFSGRRSIAWTNRYGRKVFESFNFAGPNSPVRPPAQYNGRPCMPLGFDDVYKWTVDTAAAPW
jgi:hypothetical protein